MNSEKPQYNPAWRILLSIHGRDTRSLCEARTSADGTPSGAAWAADESGSASDAASAAASDAAVVKGPASWDNGSGGEFDTLTPGTVRLFGEVFF